MFGGGATHKEQGVRSVRRPSQALPATARLRTGPACRHAAFGKATFVGHRRALIRQGAESSRKLLVAD